MSDFIPSTSLVNDNDSLERQNEKLKKIVSKLMRRVEQASSDQAVGYAHFERAIALEEQVRLRTSDLREAVDILNATNAQLATAQRETEKARQNLESAVEAIQEGFAIFDAHENLVMHNSHFLALLPDVTEKIEAGIDFESYVKLSASSQYIHYPNEMSKEEWISRRLKMHEEEVVNFTLELQDNHWLHVSEQRSADGSTIVLQTDMTDRVRLELEERNKVLDQQAKLVKATLDHIDQAVLIFDQEFRLAEWNAHMRHALNLPAKLLEKGTRVQRFKFLFEPDRVIEGASDPMNIYDWLSGNIDQALLRLEIRTNSGKEFDVFGQVMPDGSRLLTFNNITALREAFRDLRDANEHLEQRVGERTQELEDARDVAERANASKTRFVAAASHDLLQPINAAKLYLSILANTELGSRQEDIVGKTTRSFRSVENMLTALLDISKLDSGAIALNISEFPLDTIFAQVKNEFSTSASQKDIDLRILPTRAAVASDPTYLHRIVQNLASNAIRYTKSGKVLLGAKRRGNAIEIIVQDTGIGIALEDQKKIFGEFQRLKQEQDDISAMGLGLTIVERACANLGHDLSLESTPGKGTRFGVTLPLASRPERIETPDVLSKVNSPSFEDLIVLVIENDFEVQNAMMKLLEDWGASPIAASCMSSSLSQVEELGIVPDVVIADYHLDNDDNGLDVIKAIRKKYGPFIAILLTADRDENIEAEAGAEGVFIRYKPADLEELKILLRK